MGLKGPSPPLIRPATDPPSSVSKHSQWNTLFKPITHGKASYPFKSLCSGFWSHLILKVIIGRLPRQKPNSFIVSSIRLKTLEVRTQMRSKLQIALRDRINQSWSRQTALPFLTGRINMDKWRGRKRMRCSTGQAPSQQQIYLPLVIVISAGLLCFNLSILYLAITEHRVINNACQQQYPEWRLMRPRDWVAPWFCFLKTSKSSSVQQSQRLHVL